MDILRFLRSPVGIGASVLIAVGVLGSALRQDLPKSKNDVSEREIVSNDGDVSSGFKTSFSKSRPQSSSRGSESEVSTGSSSGRKVGENNRAQIKEDFQEQLRRSKGSSYITGRVFGMSGSDNPFGGEWGRGGFGGPFGGTPGGSGSSRTPERSERSRDSDRGSDVQSQRRERRDGDTTGSRRQRGSRDEGRREGESRNSAVGFTVAGQSEQNDREERARQFIRQQMEQRGIEQVSKATVMLYEDDPNTLNPPLQTTTTDEEGSFTLKQLNDSNRRYVLVVKADGYSSDARFVSLNKEPGQVYVQLRKGVSLRGTVRDAETSQGISGAYVSYPARGEVTFGVLGGTTTSITGDFTFDSVPVGSIVSFAQATGYRSTNAKMTSPNTEAEIAMVGGGAIIKGVALDRLTNKPFQGAKVWVEGPYGIKSSVITKENGEFEVKDLPGGDFTVYGVRGLKSDTQTVSLKDNETKSDISILLPSELLVTGKVVAANGGNPLPGVKVWYEAPNGVRSAVADQSGNFAFETMALDKYKVQVHEKGYLPLQDKDTTGVVETIERKIAKNASSDQLTIRLKPVAHVGGKVVQDRRGGRGGWGGRGGETTAGDESNNGVANAEVLVNYVMGRDFEQVKTTTDAAGYFFVNMPERRRASATIIARKGMQMGSKQASVGRNEDVEIRLGMGNSMSGQLLLSDETPLEGVKVSVSQQMRGRRLPGGAKLEIASAYTSFGGRLFLGLPDEQQVELAFSMPDGEKVTKTFQTSQLVRASVMFLYDPVAKDVFVDIARRDWGGRGGDRRGGRENGGRDNGNRDGGGRGGNPSPPPQQNS